MVKVIKKVKKTIVKRRRQGGANLYGIKQGVGRITKSAFPRQSANRRGPRKSRAGRMHMRQVLNAMHPSHLALPRAVGGYTVIRTTDIINSGAECILFGAFKGTASQFTDTCWLDTIAVRNITGTDNPISATNGSHFYGSTALGAPTLNGSRMVPAAITVQIMNGESLQNADGIAYIGRSKTVLDLMGSTRTWVSVFKELVSYSAPRLCSGGKLALRGVQVNAIPNNMSVLSDFVPRINEVNGDRTWTNEEVQNGQACDLEGFGPIFVYNPDNIALKYLVTIEWRVRFDPVNPAYAGHVVHPPCSESTWSKVIADAESVGHGVEDIADVTANLGVAAAAAAPFFL